MSKQPRLLEFYIHFRIYFDPTNEADARGYCRSNDYPTLHPRCQSTDNGSTKKVNRDIYHGLLAKASVSLHYNGDE
ncbi:MAG TPA: hypothetical protein ENK85_01970 [Saprospiraceae bacterium]|nr:hypothetical protein [Saprospiraceae bacterium]